MAIIGKRVSVDYVHECNHIRIIKHNMGFVCQDCGLVFPRLSYNKFMMISTITKKNEKLTNFKKKTVNFKIDKLLKFEKKFKSRKNIRENDFLYDLKLLISQFNLVYRLEEVIIIHKIISRYWIWHKTEFSDRKITCASRYIVPVILLVVNRQKNVMLSKKKLIEHCNLNTRLFNKTYRVVCKFLGYRNDFFDQFKTFVLNIIYTFDLPFSCYLDSCYVFKKFARFFTFSPKNCAILCLMISYYSEKDITTRDRKVKATAVFDHYGYRIIPLQGNIRIIFNKLQIPMKNIWDLYALYRYRGRLFSKEKGKDDHV